MNQRNNPSANAGPKAPITASKVQVYESEDCDINHDIPDPPMMNSNDEATYDDNDEGEASRRKSRFARFDSIAEASSVPFFCALEASLGGYMFMSACLRVMLSQHVPKASSNHAYV
jgi:hypothetical protein